MTLTHISRRGLLTIAVLVVALWGCVWAERQLTRTAKRNLLQAARQVQTLKVRRVLAPAVYPPAARPLVTPKPLLG